MYEATDKPNIFKYATKELSQDAVICWLIEWAYHDEPGYERLTEYGKKFIEALFKKHDKEVPQTPEKPKVWQQDNSIDVLARIGEYVLLVEDKTGTKDHSQQLNRYYEQVLKGETNAGKVGKENILPIYLKTGNQSLFDRIRIENSTPYKVFDRGDFFTVVECYPSTHPILDDYIDYLRYLEEDTQSFKKWQEGELNRTPWSWKSWQGFFRELENCLVVFDGDNGLVGFDENHNNKPRPLEYIWEGNWHEAYSWGWNWVNNPAGGFAGFWWYRNKFEANDNEISLYLQLELSLDNPAARKLCFKVYTEKPDRNIAKNCQNYIVEASGGHVYKPDKMRTGHTMTIARWKDNSWLVFNKPNGEPNIPETVKNLVKAQSILDSVEDIIK